MFFLGHMTWAFVWAVIFARKQTGKLFVPAVLMLGVLPDIDLFLKPFGVEHHTFTHSLFFWFVIFAPLFVVFGLKMIPYLVAVVQHFMFGDFLVGTVMIFWPFSQSFFGFDIPMVSFLDVALETAGLILAAGIIYFRRDLRRVLSVDRRNIAMVFPFLTLLASMLFFAVDWPLAPLVAYFWFEPFSLVTIILAHTILAVFLVVSTVQGLRGLAK